MRTGGVLEAILHRRSLRRWKRASVTSQTLSLAALRTMRTRARELRKTLDRLLHVAEARLTLPAIGSNSIVKPLHTDWAYRPELWRGPIAPLGIVAVESKTQYGREATIYHDCSVTELTMRQIRNTRETDLAPFGLRMDVFRFDGSFLSLVVDFPKDAVDGLERRHVLRLMVEVEVEKPLEIFARLNVKHGPNVEQVVRELPIGSDEVMVEFDLAYTKMNEKRLESIWLDLIFEGAEMNQILLRDVTLTRRPRADM